MFNSITWQGIKKALIRSLILSALMGIIFVFGETMIRIFLSPNSVMGDLPMYMYNTNMSFWTLTGYSSIWMFLSAIFFCSVLGGLNNKDKKNPWMKIPYGLQVFIGGIFAIAWEFTFGVIMNLGLGLAIWNYDMFHFSILGQMALEPAIMWLCLIPIIFFVDDLLRYYIWEEQRPDKFITYFTDVFKFKK